MKHAKTILPTAACVVALSLAFQMSRADNVPERERSPWEGIPEVDRTALNAAFRSMKERGRDAFPELARVMDNWPGHSSNSWCLHLAFKRITQVDGFDIQAPGDPHLLASTRNAMTRLQDYGQRHEFNAVRDGLVYLAQKGDSQDFPLFEKYLTDPVLWQLLLDRPPRTPEEMNDLKSWLSMPYRILQQRVAGTNIVRGTFDAKLYPYFNQFLTGDGYSYSTNGLRFIPSVANTGPQAAYVYEALEQAMSLSKSPRHDSVYAIITNIAPELLTMRVWFDADGNAVCDVDLAKYGISVPGLSTATNAATPAELPAAPPARPCPAGRVAVGAGILAALLLLAAFRRKLPRR